MARQQAYFTPDLFKFLDQLAKNNSREWFLANKARYDEALRLPLLRLIGDLAGPLKEVSPHFIADPKPVGGSMFRIHRDTRFSKDKTPYKTWAAARFSHERARELNRDTPVFYLHLKRGDCFLGGGLWHGEPPTVQKVRDYMVSNPASWKAATRKPAFRKRYEMEGDSLVRPPRGYDPEHELIDDIKRKDFVAGCALDDDSVLSPQLPKLIIQRYQELAPMVDWLCGALDLEF